MNFSALGLHPGLCDALAAASLTQPTPVQKIAIPAMLGGANVAVVARTGSGKTLAYGLPLLQRVRELEDAAGVPAAAGSPRAIVLTGTRELVTQTTRALKAIAHPMRLRLRMVAGGMPEREVGKQLSEPADVLVANPPRLAALVRAGRVRLEDVRIVVADEADMLLAPGQREEVELILHTLKRGTQVAWFSATLPEGIRSWIQARPEPPTLLLAKDAHQAPETVAVRNVRIRAEERIDAIHDILVATPAQERGIVFCNRRETADEISEVLTERGHVVVNVHGGRQPAERRASLERFRKGEGRILVTTELGGRGLHIEDLSFVVNYELPEKPSEYLHRIGRVGRQRAGGTAEGKVVNLVTPHDEGILADVQRLAHGGRLDTGEVLRAPRRRESQAAASAARKAVAERRKESRLARKHAAPKPDARPAQRRPRRESTPETPGGRRGRPRKTSAAEASGRPEGGGKGRGRGGGRGR
jgi:ATP-dependent RNA helicase RhlE